MIQINEVELASNLASKATENEILVVENDKYPDYQYDCDLVVEDDESGCYIYKDDVQDVFNRWYDYYYAEIMEIAGK